MQVAMGFSRNITHYGFTDLDLFFVYWTTLPAAWFILLWCWIKRLLRAAIL